MTRRSNSANAVELGGESLRILLCSPFDHAAWQELASPHLHLRIANQPPALGREKAIQELGQFVNRTIAFGSAYCEAWRQGQTLLMESDVALLDASGATVALPCVVVCRTRELFVFDLRLYLDPAPLA